MEKLVIWGASGHARVVADIAKLEGRYQLVAFVDELGNAAPAQGQSLCGVPVLGPERVFERLTQLGATHVVPGFGACAGRRALLERVDQTPLKFATLVHPRAIVASGVRLGEGSVVAAGSILNPGTEVGRGVIINTGAIVDHDCWIGDAVHIAPGARLAGNVRVGDATWIGLGAMVTEQRTVGAETLIGAGAVVVGDIPERVVAYGVPARVKRRIANND